MTAAGGSTHAPVPVLRVRTEDGRVFRFSRPFHIGRDPDCDVQIQDGHVSRRHVVVSYGNGHWQLRDLGSSNGVLIDGRRVEMASIEAPVAIRLGAEGPTLTLEVEAPEPARTLPTIEPQSVSETMFVERYFGGAIAESDVVGGRTLMIRRAYQRVQQKQRRAYLAVVGVLAVVAIAAGGFAYRAHRQIAQQRATAEELFYSMKSLDVDIANVERQLLASGRNQGRDEVQRYLERRRQMERNYDQFIAGLKLYDHTLTPQEQAILRVTRLFGECEMAAPPEYLAEVTSYIRKWQSSPRFAKAIARARQSGYVNRIAEEFQRQHLPPQFFYLALEESDFDEFASGPPTRMGIAKGMWQFVPDTAKRYGLAVGPFAGYRRPDNADDRHHWEKATRAAAAYIKDIYSTDAQASGLLVMASYNWGEQRVITMLRSMPANPRERNFWKVLAQHRDQVPKDTYDYVLSIVSAAVIGENPKLFGFDFNNPLETVLQ